jgi:two-component system nitrogen regulation response regulator GlnG
MPTLLVIDDEAEIRQLVRLSYEEPGVEVQETGSAAEGEAVFARARPDVVVLDVGLPDVSGLEAFRRLQQINARVPVLFLTGGSTTDTAIQAMALGAYEYLFNPVTVDLLQRTVASAFEAARLMATPVAVAEAETPEPAPDVLVGRCPAMHEVYKAIGRVAPHPVTVLLLGERGTGKELAARAIYQYGRRSRRPLPGHQLYGHSGAAPGERAVRPRAGRLQRGRPQAHRQVRAVLGLHPVPGRGRRHDAVSCATPAGTCRGRPACWASTGPPCAPS